MLATFKRVLADTQGATAIEYGLICSLIAMFSSLFSTSARAS